MIQGKPTEEQIEWMMLPINSSYPDYDEIHPKDAWCDKAGCRRICKPTKKQLLDYSSRFTRKIGTLACPLCGLASIHTHLIDRKGYVHDLIVGRIQNLVDDLRDKGADSRMISDRLHVELSAVQQYLQIKEQEF